MRKKLSRGSLAMVGVLLPFTTSAASSRPPALRIPLGNSNLADTATPFDVNGTGTVVK